MRTCSFGLTSAVGTAISLAGTSRVPASSAKAPVGMARPSARTARCNLKLVLIDRLPELLLQPWEKLFWQVKLARQCFRCMPSISPATAASGHQEPPRFPTAAVGLAPIADASGQGT